MKALISVLCQASEFSQIPIRDGEEPLLRQLSMYATYPIFEGANKDGAPLDSHDFNEPHAKTNLLLQLHFNRRQLKVDLRLDQKMILQKVIKLTHAMVLVISTNGHLNAALIAMELSQMAVQAMWPLQSPLLQLPGFDNELVEKCKKVNVEDISDFMNMEDEVRDRLLQVSTQEMERLANVCNRYPVVSLSYQTDKADKRSKDLIGVYEPGETVNLTVTLTRDEDDD